MKRIKKILLLASFSLCMAGVVPVSANSGVKQWYGVSSAGIICTEGDCPVTVTNEDLTFYPDENFTGSDGETGGYLEASYTFYNPSDSDITAQLLFPFETQASTYAEPDESLCKITENGCEVEKSIHYVFDSCETFNFEDYLSSFSLDYLSNEYYSKDSIVYIYGFHCDTDATEDICFKYEGPKFGPDGHGWLNHATDDENFTKYDWENPNTVYQVAFVGSDMSEQFLNHLIVYKKNDDRITSGLITEYSKQMTLYDYFMNYYYDDSEISEVDWFNACFSNFANKNSYGIYYSCNSVWEHLISSLYYILEIKSRETVVNTVSTPLYPTIKENYDPYQYYFKYYLTPASTWASFQNLNISIVTDMVLSQETMNFEKTDDGYKYHSDTLPEEDFSFCLCQSENPKYSSGNNSKGIATGFFLGLILFAFLVIIFVPIIGSDKKKKTSS